jgi:GDP-L-fucose synthase
MDYSSRIYVAGHRGMVGSAICRRLQNEGYNNVITRTRQELNLLEQAAVHRFLQEQRPDYIVIAAARVGGIQANNTYRAEFIYENLAIEANVIHGAHLADVQRLMFLGSSCIYPRDCPQPMREDHLLTGPLEPTNEPYAVSKIAGIKLCEAYCDQHGREYLSVMPTNLYGANDNYDLETSHVLPALIRKAHDAKVRGDDHMEVWGSGDPRREFLYVDDLADACVFLMQLQVERKLPGLLNIGWGEDITIRELAQVVQKVVGFDGKLVFDLSKPDGTPRKLLDTTRLKALGWSAGTDLEYGIREAYQDFLRRFGSSSSGEGYSVG